MEAVISGVDLGILVHLIWSPASNAGRFCASVLSAPPHSTLAALLCPSLPCGGCTSASAQEPTVEAAFICLVSFHTLANKFTFNLTSQDSVPYPASSTYSFPPFYWASPCPSGMFSFLLSKYLSWAAKMALRLRALAALFQKNRARSLASRPGAHNHL